MKDTINNMLDQIEHVKTNIKDSEYKRMVELLKILFELNEKAEKRLTLVLNKYCNLKTSYVELSKRFLTLYDEYRGEQTIDSVEMDWRTFLESQEES